MTQIIYNYDPLDGMLLSTAIADPSPLEPDVWLLPAYATPTPPPTAGAREAALYRDADGHVPADHTSGSWQLMPDWRGVALWSTVSGEPVTITRPGETPAEIGATDIERTEPTTVWDGLGWVVDVELAAQQLANRRTTLLAAINAERDRREELGFPYRGKWFDSTPRSVQRITAAALAVQAVLATGQPYSVDWTCADNSTLILDAAGVVGIPVALAQHAAALHDHARVLKAAVAAAGSEADLVAIDIQAGWPGAAP